MPESNSLMPTKWDLKPVRAPSSPRTLVKITASLERTTERKRSSGALHSPSPSLLSAGSTTKMRTRVRSLLHWSICVSTFSSTWRLSSRLRARWTFSVYYTTRAWWSWIRSTQSSTWVWLWMRGGSTALISVTRAVPSPSTLPIEMSSWTAPRFLSRTSGTLKVSGRASMLSTLKNAHAVRLAPQQAMIPKWLPLSGTKISLMRLLRESFSERSILSQVPLALSFPVSLFMTLITRQVNWSILVMSQLSSSAPTKWSSTLCSLTRTCSEAEVVPTTFFEYDKDMEREMKGGRKRLAWLPNQAIKQPLWCIQHKFYSYTHSSLQNLLN